MTMTLTQVSDQIEIERLLYEYVWRADRPEGPDGAGLAQCYTEDAVWEAPDYEKVCHGRKEIADHFESLQYEWPMHHFITNVRIDLDPDGLHASMTAYLMMYSRMKDPDGGPARLLQRASRYANTLVKVDGEWLFDYVSVAFHYGDPLKK